MRHGLPAPPGCSEAVIGCADGGIANAYLPSDSRSPTMRPERGAHWLRTLELAMNDSVLMWDGDWAWSLPLIVVNVMLHVAGLDIINRALLGVIARVRNHRRFNVLFGLVIGLATLLATLLHAVEAGVWAVIYWFLGAMPNGKNAMLYSLNAITTYGHEELNLTAHWRLMGALEALNGMLLFGLTTAFLYGVLQRVWPTQWQASIRADGCAPAAIDELAQTPIAVRSSV
jgi:hypothetical protein